MSWDEGIDGVHREIAGSAARRIGILAGPGTGKTSFGLMRRVVRLVEEELVPPERILLISFTRVAASDLRDKVAALQVDGADDVRATTLHGYCFRLLMQEGVLEVTGRTPRILLDHEVDLMLRDIGGDFGTIHDRRRLLEAFVSGWARSQKDLHEPPAPEHVAFGEAVHRWLLEHRAMLIGEVVPEAYKYLRANPVAYELEAFDHVIVDEYQDLNGLEQDLLDVLARNGSLCVAGDDDQSIYSVRNANPAGILDFLARPDVEPHGIAVCGRCPANVLDMANSLMAHAPGRDRSPLTPRGAVEDGTVAIVQWEDPAAEVDGIVSAIAGDIHAGRREPGEILVLTNWRWLGEEIRARLSELDVPVRSFFTQEELGHEQGKEALALLRLVADRSDAPALRVMLGIGESTGRTHAYQRVLDYARTNATTPADVLARLVAGGRVVSARALADRYLHTMDQVERLQLLALPELVDELLPIGNADVADLRAVAVDALASSESAADLLEAMVASITQDEVPQSPDFVRVMSLHKSKGLTANCVYVAGSVHGVVPTIRSDDHVQVEAAMSEGRRLFYVALTRAADELVISYAATMDVAHAMRRGVKFTQSSVRLGAAGRRTARVIPSPYVSELGPQAPRPVPGASWLGHRRES